MIYSLLYYIKIDLIDKLVKNMDIFCLVGRIVGVGLLWQRNQQSNLLL